MKTKLTIYSFAASLLIVLTLLNYKAYAQDLLSYNSGQGIAFDSASNVLSIHMTIKNFAFNDASAFDVPAFIINVNTLTAYEIDRVHYLGLSHSITLDSNVIQVSYWEIDLDNKPQVPSGTYRAEVRINDNHAAAETNFNNNTEVFNNTTFQYTALNSGVKEQESILSNFGNYPNPASDITNFTFTLTEKAQTILTIYDISGREAAQLVNQELNFGTHTIGFNTGKLTKGVYFYTLKVNNVISTKKMIVL